SIDSYSASGPYATGGMELYRHTNGDLYASGVSGGYNGNIGVILRSTDGGASWSSFYVSQGFTPAGMTIDGTGKIYVIGDESLVSGSDWHVRRSVDGGATWTQVDSYSYATPGDSAAFDIGVDSNNHVYVSGFGTSAGKRHWVVRKSVDSGATWTTVDDFLYSGLNTSEARSIAFDSGGGILVVGGGGQGGAFDYRWIVRRSTDGGASWATVDDFFTGGECLAEAISVGASGNIYVAGYADAYPYRWYVRSSSDGGNTWGTLEAFRYAAGQSSSAYAVTETAPGILYAAGCGRETSATLGVCHWIVRKSTNGGAAWTTVQDISGSTATGVSRDGAGNPIVLSGLSGSLVVQKSTDGGTNWGSMASYQNTAELNLTGYSVKGVGPSTLYAAGYMPTFSGGNWIVRKSANSGASWSQVDSFQHVGGGATPLGIGVDLSGAVYVVGSGLGTGGAGIQNDWIVRRSTNAGTSWTTVDQFELGANTAYNQANGFGIDPATGDRYVVGSGGTFKHWIVRKSTDGTTWSTVDDYQPFVNKNAEAIAFAADSSGNLYVAGMAEDTAFGTYHVVVRKSTNAGGSWATVADIAGMNPFAGGVAVDPSGNVYFSYSAYTFWKVMKSTNGGGAWTQVDHFTHAAPNFQYLYPRSMHAGSNGALYVVGEAGGSAIVRMLPAGGTTWYTIEDYQVAAGASAAIRGMGFDGAGNLITIGAYTHEVNGAQRWTVRRANP
ncbi:MAG TPA: hypothetical protein VM598_07585, partial [Bdellovibrionota bacterium]|nr:hypothetical protein [Bdellovibrionota bacterium]